jgi:chemotaxis signal transduction protein
VKGPIFVPVLVPLDLEVLQRRTRRLASGAQADLAERTEERHVAFRLRGRPCAVDVRVVERAVARLSRPLPVPLKDGGERLVAFVDERPVPVVDLAVLSGGSQRGPAELEARPALLVTTPTGPVAVVVEGPLELLEDHLAWAAGMGDPASIRTTGVLSGGSTALDPAWLQEWAAGAARP